MSALDTTIKPSEGYNYYHSLVTWASFETIGMHLNRTVSGSSSKNWIDFIAEKYPQFKRCLTFNCGNGWVERELYQKGVVAEITGTDIMQNSLDAAAAQAIEIGMPAKYLKLDVNNDPFPTDDFDLVVNHAALHHVAKIDFVTRAICTLLPESGVFASYDYTGPHRNQYDYDLWSRVVEFNEAQPEHLRNTNLAYPHLRTMLHMDPSEAVHSELITEHIRRYFTIEHKFALGGSFAYLLMHDHANLFKQKETAEGKRLIAEIFKIDQDLTMNNVDRSLFTFFMLRPNKAVLKDVDKLARWTLDENVRESRAAENGGRYYSKTALEIIYDELAMEKWRVKHGVSN